MSGRLKIAIPILLLCSLVFWCKRIDKGTYHRTHAIGNNLYVEVYTIFGQGAFGTDLDDDYLTDSTHFRVRIGLWDDSNDYYTYIFNSKGDSITISRMEAAPSGQRGAILEHNTYKIADLKKIDNINSKLISNIPKGN